MASWCCSSSGRERVVVRFLTTGQAGGVHRLWRVLAIAAVGLWLTAAVAWWALERVHDPVQPAVATGFMRDMGVHHNQAVNLALLGAVKGSPDIQATSLKIIRGQSLEMGMMHAWTMAETQTAQASGAPMMGWMADRYARLGQHIPEYDKFILACQAHPDQMPGMATLDELSRLQQATGVAFQHLWLELMIRHHAAAIVMTRFAADHAETSRFRSFAASMLRDQVQESVQLLTLARRDGLDMQNHQGR
ncbi:hypothetical protein B9Z52_05725 [Limnohabitans sp. Jir72]|nr:hypothetical protein B9Z52_05725 [Limnohabitans sp. Jir72]